MKKTISINIGGQIFHIEEDGYEKLRNYLNAIQKYFAAYEDSKEILSDIEGRIAEKFLKNQKLNDQQAIALDDVDGLIKTMGTVSDFEAIEEDEDLATGSIKEQEIGSGEGSNGTKIESSQSPEGYKYEYQYKHGKYEYQYKYDSKTGEKQTNYTYNKKPLIRDTKRKLLGGVAAGLAHYFNTDPLIIRLILLFLFLGFPTLGGIIGNNAAEFFGPFSGIVLLLYIALWISFPASNTLEEDKNMKKFYRSTDKKVLGGVAGGVAAYFGLDLGVVRLVWVLGIFLFGTGIVLYIILWAITPKAETLTEKMEMTGQPITLENIETNVKQALQPDLQQENLFTKLLLFPFRAIAAIFKGLTPLAKFVVSSIRVFAGLIMVIVGASALISLIIALFGVVGGWATLDGLNDLPFPANFFLHEVSPVAYFFLFLAISVPFAAVAWTGVSLLSNQNKFSSATWQTMLGLFLAGILGASIYAGRYGREFRKEGTLKTTKEYALPSKTLLLDLNETARNNYENMNIDLEGYEGDKVKVISTFSAQGRNREKAEQNAGLVRFNIEQKDSVITFDRSFTLADNIKYRAQRASIDIYLPLNKPFAMSRAFYNHFGIAGNQAKSYELDNDNDETFRSIRWEFTKDGLVCLNRTEAVNSDNSEEYDNDSNIKDLTEAIGLGFGETFDQSFDEKGEYVKGFDVKNFDRLSVSGAYIVKISEGAAFKVEADGREKDIADLKIEVKDGLLKIRNDKLINLSDDTKRIGLTISMPTVKAIECAGATQAKVYGFKKLNNLNVHLSGASKTWLDVNTQNLDIELAGAGQMQLHGQADRLTAKLSGACKLEAEGMKINHADVSAAGASNASMGRIADLQKHTSGVSKIDN